MITCSNHYNWQLQTLLMQKNMQTLIIINIIISQTIGKKNAIRTNVRTFIINIFFPLKNSVTIKVGTRENKHSDLRHIIITCEHTNMLIASDTHFENSTSEKKSQRHRLYVYLPIVTFSLTAVKEETFIVNCDAIIRFRGGNIRFSYLTVYNII